MLNLNLCDCSNAYILVKGSITVVGAGTTAAARQVDRNHKQVIENWKLGTVYRKYNLKNSIQVDNSKDIDVAIPVYN